MEVKTILQKLLEVGHSGNFDELPRLSKLHEHWAAARLTVGYVSGVVSFFKALGHLDQIAFVKSVAMIEERAGTLGSVTVLQHLLPIVYDPNRTLLNWILENTDSYWYYAHNARSVAELDRIVLENACRRRAGEQKSLEQYLEAKNRKAKEATGNLYNAVRRGDFKAVRALIEKGADVSTPAPDGRTLIEVAEAVITKYDSIASLLRNAEKEGVE